MIDSINCEQQRFRSAVHFVVAILITCFGLAASFGAPLVTYDIANANTLFSSTVAPGLNAFNIDASALSATGVTPLNVDIGVNGHFLFSTWQVGGTVNSADNYYSFTITPETGFQIDFTTVTYSVSALETDSWQLRSSVDGYTSNFGVHTDSSPGEGGQDPFTDDVSSIGMQTGAVTFRLYGYNSGGDPDAFEGLVNNDGFFGPAGSGRNVVINGKVSSVPPADLLVAYDISSADSFVSPTVSPSGTAANITASALSATGVTPLMVESGFDGHFVFSNWPPGGTVNPADKYYSFTITPDAGFKIDFKTISYSVATLETVNWQLRSSVDGYTSNFGVHKASNPLWIGQDPFTDDASSIGTQTGSVTFRLYGYNSAGEPDAFDGLVNNDLFFGPQGSGRNLIITGTVRTVDNDPPLCELLEIRRGPPAQILVRVQDTDSGLNEIKVVEAINAIVNVPPIAPGTTESQIVVATKIEQTKKSVVELELVDVDGNITRCDPVITILELSTGKSLTQTFTGIPKAESFVTVQNGIVGLQKLQVKVNGQQTWMIRLRDNLSTTIDISSVMREGDNTITLIGQGNPGASGLVIIADSGVGQQHHDHLLNTDRRHGQLHRLVWGKLVGEAESSPQR